MIQALVSPADGPIGDSALAVDDGTATVYDMNDARPPDTSAIERFGIVDAQFLQFSGAIWFPMVYDPDPLRPFRNKARYLEEYAAQERPRIDLHRAEWAALPRTPDLLDRLKAWWEPLLDGADRICAGVGGPVLLDFGTDRIVIDFPRRIVLSRFGTLDRDDTLTCQMHGFRFDLRSGRCLTSDGFHIAAARRQPVHDAAR